MELEDCRQLVAQGDVGSAIGALRELAVRQPNSAEVLRLLGEALLAAGLIRAAADALRCAVEADSEQAETYFLLRDALRASGQLTNAFLAGIAGDALAQGSAEELFKLGTVYYMNQRVDEASRWFRLAAARDPEAAVKWHRNLSVNLWGQGRFDEAQYHRDAAFRRQSIFVDGATDAARSVLVLCVGTRGDVPVDFLIPKASNTVVKWIIEYAGAEQEGNLPHFDAVFNAIGDHDLSGPAQQRVERFLRHCGKPIFNAPAQVAATTRDRMSGLLRDIGNTLVPSVVRIDAVRLKKYLPTAREMGLPLLLRPAGSHGGEFLVRLESAAALAEFSPLDVAAYYVTNYHDYRSADGCYRKYRVVFVDRQPYAYHLAIADHWMVHYETAGMAEEPWKLAEERRFLDDPHSAIGQDAMTAIAAIGRRLDLDFGGVDFSILPDGRVLVFEANATMLVHPEDADGTLAFKNEYVERIVAAFDAMLAGAGTPTATKRHRPFICE